MVVVNENETGTNHPTLWGWYIMCINHASMCVVAKMSHSIHAIAWQLIVNELLVDAKALIMLGFLRKTYIHIHIIRILQVQSCLCYAYLRIYVGVWACAMWGVCVVCMEKYTDGVN